MNCESYKSNSYVYIIIFKFITPMMFFQSELGWSVLELLDRSAESGCLAPLRKQKTKRIGGDRPLPLRCLSQLFLVEEKINCSGNEFLCVPFTDGVTWYL